MPNKKKLGFKSTMYNLCQVQNEYLKTTNNQLPAECANSPETFNAM